MECTIVDDLNREWRDLVATKTYAEHLDRWIERWPALSGYLEDLGSIRPCTARPDPNALLEALAEEFRSGSYPAGRTLLQCMLPQVLGAVKFARGTAYFHEATAQALAGLWTAIGTCLDDGVSQAKARDLFDALRGGTSYGQALVSVGLTSQAVTEKCYANREFSDQLDQALIDGRDPSLSHGTKSGWDHCCRCPDCRHFHDESCGRTRREPGSRPTRTLSAKLWSAVRAAVSQPNWYVTEVPSGPLTIDADLDDDLAVVTGLSDDDILGASGTVLRLIAWGQGTGAISAQEAALLVRMYVTDDEAPAYTMYATIAAEDGLTANTVAQRVSRAVARLRRAVEHDDERYLAVWDQTHSALATAV